MATSRDRLVARVGFEAGKAAPRALDLPPINELPNAERANRSRSGAKTVGFGPAIGPAKTELTLADARAKLDAAIVAEEWAAVKVIAERVRELERADVVDLTLERARRR